MAAHKCLVTPVPRDSVTSLVFQGIRHTCGAQTYTEANHLNIKMFKCIFVLTGTNDHKVIGRWHLEVCSVGWKTGFISYVVYRVSLIPGWQRLFKFFKLDLFYMWMFWLHACMHTNCVLGAVEVGRGYWISWNWRYRWLWLIIQVLEIETSSAKTLGIPASSSQALVL